MQILEDMFKVEVQNADEICIGDYIVGTWNDIDVETFTHATTHGEVCALDFSLATHEDLNNLTPDELEQFRADEYILVSSVYRKRVPPPEERGTVIDIIEMTHPTVVLTVPRRAIWTDKGSWFTDTDELVPSAYIRRWNLVAVAHKRD